MATVRESDWKNLEDQKERSVHGIESSSSEKLTWDSSVACTLKHIGYWDNILGQHAGTCCHTSWALDIFGSLFDTCCKMLVTLSRRSGDT